MDDDKQLEFSSLEPGGTGPEPGPPFASVPWQAPSRLARLLTRGIVITISVSPSLLLMWVLAPPELKYELRKQARWLPFAARYASWWLRQRGW